MPWNLFYFQVLEFIRLIPESCFWLNIVTKDKMGGDFKIIKSRVTMVTSQNVTMVTSKKRGNKSQRPEKI